MQSLVHQFLNFCRSKPADEAYDADNGTCCAMYQFLTHAGLPVSQAGYFSWNDTSDTNHKLLPPDTSIVGNRPHTFGALADRIEAALSSRLEGVS